jgi:hypothetical protein
MFLRFILGCLLELILKFQIIRIQAIKYSTKIDMGKNKGARSNEYSELADLNKLQAESKVLPGGEYAFEKEGFEEDDFSGKAEGGEDSDPEENWGEVEDFGQEGAGEGNFEGDDEDFEDTRKFCTLARACM